MSANTPPDGPDILPERPEEFFASLGLGLPSADEDVGALDALRDQLKRDLADKQGPHRERSALARRWPFFLAALAGAIFATVYRPMEGASVAVIAAEVIAGIAGLVCLVAAAIAPDRPGASERVARGGLALAVLALGAQAFMARDWSREMVDAGIKCGVAVFAFGLIPLALGFFGLKRSGLPVRSLHAVALVVSAFAMTGASVLSHCPMTNLWHVLGGHVALPTVLAALAWLGVYRMFVRFRAPPVA